MLTVNFSSRAALLLLVMALPLHANDFHYGIDASHQLQENATGQLTGLNMHWVYDAAVTAMLIEGEDLQPNNRAATLKTVGDLMLSDLKTHAYFTTITLQRYGIAPCHCQRIPFGFITRPTLATGFCIAFCCPANAGRQAISDCVSRPHRQCHSDV